MQFASGSEQSALASPEQVNERLRQFWRLRRHAEPERRSRSRISMSTSPTSRPLDSTKTFVGTNGTYYDERWRFMEWRGRRRSWNWAAALSFGGWLAYRRMYRRRRCSCSGWVCWWRWRSTASRSGPWRPAQVVAAPGPGQLWQRALHDAVPARGAAGGAGRWPAPGPARRAGARGRHQPARGLAS